MKTTGRCSEKKQKGTKHTRWAQEISREMDRGILICPTWHDPSVLNMQTNPRLFETKQLGAPFQNGASKIQWLLSAWQRTQKEKNGTDYCFTLWAAKSHSQNDLYCRVFNGGIFWISVDSQTQMWLKTAFWPQQKYCSRQGRNSQTNKGITAVWFNKADRRHWKVHDGTWPVVGWSARRSMFLHRRGRKFRYHWCCSAVCLGSQKRTLFERKCCPH